MLPELLRFRRNVNSQAGEDGVLAEILRRLEITRGWFCEFGAWDGTYLSNTYLLLDQGWQGVMIEGDEQRFNDLRTTAQKYPDRLYPICRYVSHIAGPDSLASLLAPTPIPMDFDVLSVDVDGLDYYIWEAFQNFKPKIVIIEVNSNYPPGVEHLESGSNAHSSFTSMAKLGARKGYIPVLHTGNVFFVRSDLIDKVARGNTDLSDWTNQFQHTSLSAQGSLGRRLSRFRQRVTNRMFYSHLRQLRR
jgi:hypothetical protein